MQGGTWDRGANTGAPAQTTQNIAGGMAAPSARTQQSAQTASVGSRSLVAVILDQARLMGQPMSTFGVGAPSTEVLSGGAGMWWGGNAHQRHRANDAGAVGSACWLSPVSGGVAGSPGGLRVPEGGGISVGDSQCAPKVSRGGKDARQAEILGTSPEDEHDPCETCDNTFTGQYRVRTRKRKRKHRETHLTGHTEQQQVSLDGMTARKLARKTSKRIRRRKAKRQRRKLQFYTQAQQHEQPKLRKTVKAGVKIGAWNVQKLGAPNGLDQDIKHHVMFEFMESRGWSAALLSDVGYGGDETRGYNTSTQQWTVVVHGRVAIALNAKWAAQWRLGGCKKWVGDSSRTGVGRALSLEIPKQGWRKGYHLAAVYAPISTAPAAQREQFREQIERVVTPATAYNMLIIGGDFNAELGQSVADTWRPTVGPHCPTRRRATAPGVELVR